MNTTSSFAVRLREKREEKGLTQAQLAALVGVSTQSLSFYERVGEKGKSPTLETAVKIAQALDVSLDWLTGLEVTKPTTTEFKTAGDVARVIISLNNATNGLIGPFDVDPSVTGNTVGVIKGYGVIPNNEYIQLFLMHWYRMKKLHIDEEIDDSLFEDIIKDRLFSLDSIPATQTRLIPQEIGEKPHSNGSQL